MIVLKILAKNGRSFANSAHTLFYLVAVRQTTASLYSCEKNKTLEFVNVMFCHFFAGERVDILSTKRLKL